MTICRCVAAAIMWSPCGACPAMATSAAPRKLISCARHWRLITSPRTIRCWARPITRRRINHWVAIGPTVPQNWITAIWRTSPSQPWRASSSRWVPPPPHPWKTKNKSPFLFVPCANGCACVCVSLIAVDCFDFCFFHGDFLAARSPASCLVFKYPTDVATITF